MSEKLVLIDGHSILNRAFYGVPDLTNSQGLHTNAVYGFLNIMLKIIEEEKPDYLAVAFDVKKPTFRHKMYTEYKGTRKPMPEELHQQVPVIKDVLRAMRVPVITLPGYEADDILGTIATVAQKEGKEVSLVSGDRDLLQLASEHILIRIPKTKRGGTEIEDYHTEEVIEKYGITPKQVIDMKGLMGDSADNIPGVPGIGEKTAGKILAAFPSVEEAYENIEQVEPKRARELLRANKELAFLSKELATIKTDCPVEFSFEDAKYENLFTEEAFEWIKKLELKSLEKRFDASVISNATKTETVFELLSDQKQIKQFVKALLKTGTTTVCVGFLGDEWANSGAVKKKMKKKSGGQLNLVFDEDSMDLSIAEEEEDKTVQFPFLGMSISYQDKETVTGCMFVSDELTGEFLIETYREIAAKMEKVIILNWKNAMHLTTPLLMPEAGKTAANQQAFADDDISQTKKLFGQMFDVSIGAYLLNPLKDTYEVEDIARDFLGETVPSYADLFGKKRTEEIDREEMSSQLLQYLGNLSYVPLGAYHTIKEQLQAKEMETLMEQIEMPTAYYLYQMEREGVHADKEELQEISRMLEQQVLNLETDIYDLAGEEFNINSPKQLGVILFEKLKLPYAKKTKTGYSTSADILEKLKNEDPIVAKILEYRQVSKLKSTYADGLPVFIENDERIHGKFNQTITATGRISSTEPNLQNIPIRMELGREIRKVFKPKAGCVFLDADYSQIELRVLAHMSQDEQLIDAYRKNQDIHRSTASKVFHTPFDEVTDLQRRNAKAVNFGIVYGISSFGLGQDLNITKKEAQEYIDQYFATYPAVKQFIDGLVEKAKKTGYAVTMFGRKRPVPELSSSNFMQRNFGERIAMNSPIQGTAADIIKIAMIRVANRLKEENLRARIVLQVHDELLVETPVEEKEQVRRILSEEMEQAVKLDVPLEVEVLEGKDWKEAH
ncbi:MAG: DNA polymerase I [Butyribacter sp.]|nr:DNA polymerase I [bacterium]MDY3853374.1 DNA polymerase I [Butyribacter sp.]